MRTGVGIDTGGTYTDAVIYDFDAKTILASAKALTTKDDLAVGISNALDELPQDALQAVELVSLLLHWRQMLVWKEKVAVVN